MTEASNQHKCRERCRPRSWVKIFKRNTAEGLFVRLCRASHKQRKGAGTRSIAHTITKGCYIYQKQSNNQNVWHQIYAYVSSTRTVKPTGDHVVLTLRLLLSYIYIYIYGAPSKARNANVVYIWTYVWQRWNSLFLFAAQYFNTESMQRGFLCHICV